MKSDPGLVERFHRVLVEEIVQAAPDYLEKPFTVAEIYQSLMPYRTHRDRLGVEMNGDYEDILLRLLAGEGDLLLLDSSPARTRIRKELEHPNPNTGIYREFAAVEVRLNPETLPADLPAPEGAVAARRSPQATERPPPSGDELSNHAHPPRTEPAGASPAPRPACCPECGVDLPDRDTLRFCPSCGTDVFIISCSSCGEKLERAWRYCVACGSATA